LSQASPASVSSGSMRKTSSRGIAAVVVTYEHLNRVLNGHREHPPFPRPSVLS
jgi:hypothetical protein